MNKLICGLSPLTEFAGTKSRGSDFSSIRIPISFLEEVKYLPTGCFNWAIDLQENQNIQGGEGKKQSVLINLSLRQKS